MVGKDSIVFRIACCFLFFMAQTVIQAEPFGGYTLFNPMKSATTYLIDEDGATVHSWQNSSRGGYSVYLLENGNLLRPAEAKNMQLFGGAAAGLVQEIDPDGNIVWEFEYNSADYLTHHDLEPMPNGNVLCIAWEVKSSSEAETAGLNPSAANRGIWPDHLIEIEPDGKGGADIVWEWHAWDHLVQDLSQSNENYGVIGEHPELLDINTFKSGGMWGADWMHINGVSYNPELDRIVISSHFLNEFYVIDHSTTTEEAAGHTGGNSGKGGDFLYRWGYPSNYDRQGDNRFDVIHCSWWVPKGCPGEGNILVFNNEERAKQSEIVEITPPMDDNDNYIINSGQAFGPTEPTWTFTKSDFYSVHLGSNQRLPNGNTFICEATDGGYLLEVDPEGNVVWDFEHSYDEIARAIRYPSDYKGLGPLGVTKVLPKSASTQPRKVWTQVTPGTKSATIHFTDTKGISQVTIFSLDGKRLFVQTVSDDFCTWNAKNLPAGMYMVTVNNGNNTVSNYINLVK